MCVLFVHVCVRACANTQVFWPTGGTGDKLGEILKNEGFNFQAMEVRVRQLVSESERTATLGGWHSAISLKNLGWTECLPQCVYFCFGSNKSDFASGYIASLN